MAKEKEITVQVTGSVAEKIGGVKEQTGLSYRFLVNSILNKYVDRYLEDFAQFHSFKKQ